MSQQIVSLIVFCVEFVAILVEKNLLSSQSTYVKSSLESW